MGGAAQVHFMTVRDNSTVAGVAVEAELEVAEVAVVPALIAVVRTWPVSVTNLMILNLSTAAWDGHVSTVGAIT